MTNLSLPPQHPEFSEFTLVEQLAIALFAELGWETANCFCDTYDLSNTLRCKTTVEGLDITKGGHHA